MVEEVEEVEVGRRCPYSIRRGWCVLDDWVGGGGMGEGGGGIEEEDGCRGREGGRKEESECAVDDTHVAQHATAAAGGQRVFLGPSEPVRCSWSARMMRHVVT